MPSWAPAFFEFTPGPISPGGGEGNAPKLTISPGGGERTQTHNGYQSSRTSMDPPTSLRLPPVATLFPCWVPRRFPTPLAGRGVAVPTDDTPPSWKGGPQLVVNSFPFSRFQRIRCFAQRPKHAIFTLGEYSLSFPPSPASSFLIPHSSPIPISIPILTPSLTPTLISPPLPPQPHPNPNLPPSLPLTPNPPPTHLSHRPHPSSVRPPTAAPLRFAPLPLSPHKVPDFRGPPFSSFRSAHLSVVVSCTQCANRP